MCLETAEFERAFARLNAVHVPYITDDLP